MKLFFATCVSMLMLVKAASADILEKQPYDRVFGDENAPVTIVEYSSLSCPHCAQFHNDVLPELKEKYIDTGKVRLLARNFPLNASALHGSMLTMCVPEDKYYKYLEVLFATQKKWAMSVDYMENLKTIAKVGGMSEEAFDACIADKELEEKVLEIRRVANDNIDIEATPTFYINGEKLQGTASVETFSDIIDKYLSKQ